MSNYHFNQSNSPNWSYSEPLNWSDLPPLTQVGGTLDGIEIEFIPMSDTKRYHYQRRASRRTRLRYTPPRYRLQWIRVEWMDRGRTYWGMPQNWNCTMVVQTPRVNNIASGRFIGVSSHSRIQARAKGIRLWRKKLQ